MPRYFAVIPAAGSGSRMGGDAPKQYVRLCDRPLMYHSLALLCGDTRIEKVFVVLAQSDSHWGRHDWSALGAKLEVLRCGGATRHDTVANALRAIKHQVFGNDWIVVHDAARPCLSQVLLDRLIAELASEVVGGLLATPVADTLKRDDGSSRARATESREHLWQAQTPQMFRFHWLLDAMRAAREQAVTDEAQAIESLGARPKLVRGDMTNLKVTFPEDLALAELILIDRKK